MNHELIRYTTPKGKSLDFLTQEKVNDIFSNINSYVRKSKKDSTPYDLVLKKFGKEFLDAIGIKRIPNKKVKLLQIA
jgi:IS30 family transposase